MEGTATWLLSVGTVMVFCYFCRSHDGTVGIATWLLSVGTVMVLCYFCTSHDGGNSHMVT